jgi:hypothetical protein
MNIDEAWLKLQSNSKKEMKESNSLRIDWIHNSHDLWLGFNVHGQPFIALEIKDFESLKRDYNEKFFSFEFEKVSRFSKSFLEIRLRKMHQKDLFLIFIKDIVSFTNEMIGVKELSSIVLGRIESWDDFFSRENDKILSREELIGLWGELEFFKAAIDKNKDNEFVLVNSWQSRSGIDKDFRFNLSCVEVKSSMARKNVRFKISSEIQLENESDNPLFLVGYVLSPDVQVKYTLDTLIDFCRSKILSSKSLQEFNTKIFKRGYFDVDKDKYANYVFGIGELHCFKICEEFPKITRANCKTAISNVQYELNPHLCFKFSVEPQEIYNGIC